MSILLNGIKVLCVEIKMEIDEALAAMKKYEEVVKKYVPLDQVDVDSDKNLYDIIKGACLEALVILQGDEAKFVKCLETAKENTRRDFGFDFDTRNTPRASSYIVTLARLVK